MEYLGHFISPRGVEPDQLKFRLWFIGPFNHSQITTWFSWSYGLLMTFQSKYASIAQPFTDLLKKGAFFWITDSQKA